MAVAPGEERALFFAATYFFFVLGSYYVLRPLRDEMGIVGGGDRLSWLFTGTFVGTLLVQPAFGALVSRWPRRVFIPIVYHVLAAALVVFSTLLRLLPAAQQLPVARAFFVFAAVFNLFAVSVFWGFMVDLFRPEQGKRLFGFIGAGGTLGAVAGSALTAAFAKSLGPVNLILVAALVLELAVVCIHRLVAARGVDSARTAGGAGAAGGEPALDGAPPGRGALSGLKLVFQSPYLLGICAFMFLDTASSTFVYVEQSRLLRAAAMSAAERTAFFARIDLAVNVLTVLTQMLATSRVLGLLGAGAVLAALPAATASGFAGLALAPGLGTLFAVQVGLRSLGFALIRPARELLYTVVSREEKYASKTFIDTFVFRGGDVVSAWLDVLLHALGLGTRGIALLFAPLAVVWVVLSGWLGRRQAARAQASEENIDPAARRATTPALGKGAA